MSRSFKILSISLLAITAAATGFFYLQNKAENSYQQSTSSELKKSGITWGIDFSQSQAEYLGLDWKKTFLALINELRVKHIKLHTNWSWVEGKEDNFYFNDIDWQMRQAEQKKVKIIYVVGIKTGRWPECHTPTWADNLSKEDEQAKALAYITTVVKRYKNSSALASWQVENEPLLHFGNCPSWYYQNQDFLKQEIALVKSLDKKHTIIVSDSGELSNWQEVAQLGDVVGITMYRNAWRAGISTFGINAYAFLEPKTYTKKAAAIKEKYGKDVICIELQAEPWPSKPLMQSPLGEQLQSMNPQMFEENIQFAKETGLKEFYFWGAEWWYWLKEKQNKPEIWNDAQKLFQSS